MAEIKVNVSGHIPGFVELLKKVDGIQAFPHVLGALNKLAYMYQETWRSFASGTPIPGSPRVIHSRGGYLRSIQVNLADEAEKVIFTDYEAHKYIEDGHDEVDLKPGLLKGDKARQGVNGPYNIVAFRHGVPETTVSNRPMPLNIYTMIKKETDKADANRKTGISRVTGRVPVTPTNPGGRVYNWGARIPASNTQGMRTQLHSRYTWKSGKYAGMVRMQSRTQKAKHSHYITFRVVSIRSAPNSWILPAVPGVAIRQAVADTMQEICDDMIREAFERDMGS